MGAAPDYDRVEPYHYPLIPSWLDAIAPLNRFRLRPTGFPARNWNPDILSLVTLAEFAATDWRAKLDPGAPPGEADTQREVDHLIELAKVQRAARLDEILAQYTGHHRYDYDLLMIQPETHPQTRLLLKIASRVTELTMAHFKYSYNRARPAQYRPALMPPLDTAGHPSYPNGHALFGLMKAYSVADAVPQMLGPMLLLAERISHNAEIGGFHFPSDAVASRHIAETAMPLLRGCDSYVRAVDAAKLEWQGILAQP